MLKTELNLPPKHTNSEPEILVCCEPVVIIGANGSGKSKLGFWIEQNQLNPKKLVHRISAQKSLDFPDYVQLKGLEQAENELLGYVEPTLPITERSVLTSKIWQRWPGSSRSNLDVGNALNDCEKALTLLFAKKSQRDSEIVKLVKEMEFEGKNEQVKVPNSPDEILLNIWEALLPHRKLVIENGQIKVLNPASNSSYQARQMSDGERVAFYLMAQCLCVPDDSIVIVDEPEIHLHKSLMNEFWSKIEKANLTACLFILLMTLILLLLE